MVVCAHVWPHQLPPGHHHPVQIHLILFVASGNQIHDLMLMDEVLLKKFDQLLVLGHVVIWEIYLFNRPRFKKWLNFHLRETRLILKTEPDLGFIPAELELLYFSSTLLWAFTIENPDQDAMGKFIPISLYASRSKVFQNPNPYNQIFLHKEVKF
ncbi:hypothetical protein G9A89_019157 [Geosiphon pyriformis]|nr:hypothetical protein G9A89_019157 [Geosiphon pyriformis]